MPEGNGQPTLGEVVRRLERIEAKMVTQDQWTGHVEVERAHGKAQADALAAVAREAALARRIATSALFVFAAAVIGGVVTLLTQVGA